MPELPEVETIRRALEARITGRRIASVDPRRSALRVAMPPDLAARVLGRRISGVSRRAKYLLIGLEDDDLLIAHLGMSGRIRTIDPAAYQNRVRDFDFDMIVQTFPESLSPGNEQLFYWGSAAADQQGSRNYMGVKSKAIDAMIAALLAAHVFVSAPHDIVGTLRSVAAADPDAELFIHPECGCASQAMAFGNERTQILSTEKMIDYARRSPKQRFLVATETGILHRLKREAPGKRFEAVRDDAECRYMKLTTLEKVRDSLRDGRHEVTVAPELADRARLAIERMVAIGA